jgi:CubicO group peptidase (beta-lactamase class C family)
MKNSLILAFVSLVLLVPGPVVAEPDFEAILPTFEAYAEKARQEWGTPGMAVAIVAGDRIVYSRGFGQREAGGLPVTPETIFQIGSISKSFTASLVGQLVDEEKLSWTERVVDRLPDFQMYDPWVTREFTVEDTMSQRSGMAPYAGDFLAFMGRSREEMMEAIRRARPISSARTQFAYVNNLWLVAARLVETCTGKSWESNVQERIFEPLNMTASTTGLEAFYDAPNHATPHQRGARGAVALPESWPFAAWVYNYGPAGGINSNVLDMARYARMQLSGAVDGRVILSKTALDHLHSPHIFVANTPAFPAESVPEVGLMSYCLGFIRQEPIPQPILWHNGGTSGCKSVLGLFPHSEVAIVVLTNFADTELPEALMYKLYDLILERPEQDYSANFLATHKAKIPPRPVRPLQPAPHLPLKAYAGTYLNETYGRLTVSVDGDGLKALLGQDIAMRLEPWNRDTFVFRSPINPEDEPEFASFQLDRDGLVISVSLDFLQDPPGGAFTRHP